MGLHSDTPAGHAAGALQGIGTALGVGRMVPGHGACAVRARSCDVRRSCAAAMGESGE